MQPKNQPNELERLAQRVEAGDAAAKTRLERQMEPSMALIVRRVLERGTANSSLERKILVAAQRLGPQDSSGPHDARTAPLAHNLCQMVINRLWPGQTAAPCQPTLTV